MHVYTHREEKRWRVERREGGKVGRKKERKEHEVVRVRIQRGFGMGWGRVNNNIKR